MLKRRLCEARFEWRLTCEGPLLIADGRYEKPKTDKDKGKYPDKIFISRAGEAELRRQVLQAGSGGDLKLPFYVPGTSLRGPFRAQAERILRSVLPGEPPASACDPFQMDPGPSQSCSKRLDENPPNIPYSQACPACRIFGCTGTASRIQFTDADVGKTARSVYRDMIGIDRFTGGVFQGEVDDQTKEKKGGGANMRYHVLEGSSFSTIVTITNFELWHLGLLAFVFRDFEEGLVSIGSGKTKGFGQVKGSVGKIVLTYPAGRQEGKIQHLGSLVSEEERQAYGLENDAPPPFEMARDGSGGLALYEKFLVPSRKDFWAAVAPSFTALIKAEARPGNAA